MYRSINRLLIVSSMTTLSLYINSFNVGLSIDYNIRKYFDQRNFRYSQFVNFALYGNGKFSVAKIENRETFI
jgi:hypothetical protein